MFQHAPRTSVSKKNYREFVDRGFSCGRARAKERPRLDVEALHKYPSLAACASL